MAETINNSASTVYNFNGGSSESATSNVLPINLQSSTGLTLTKTANPTTFLAGEIITYTITITNNSASFLNGVRIIDNLGGGNLAYVLSSASLSTGTTTYPVNPVATSPLTFTLQQLGVGARMTLTYKAQVIFNLPSTVSMITNTVQGIGYTASGTITGFANKTIEKKTESDFSITKTSSVIDVMSGQPFNYFITLSNNTNEPVNVSSITDTLPANYNLSSANLRIGSGSPVSLVATDYTLSSSNVLNVTSVTGSAITVPANSTTVLTLVGFFD